MKRGAQRAGAKSDVGGPGPERYQMREKLVDVGDDFWIENGAGRKIFKIDGKAVRVRDTFAIKDANGRTVAQIQERMLRVKDDMEVEDGRSRRAASVKKAVIDPVRDRYTVQIKGGPDLEVKGNILDHEYKIGEGRHQVAEVSKKWFRVRDTYGVEIAPGQDDGVILAITVCLEEMSR